MKIAISAESTVDLTKELLEKYDIHTTPFSINFNNELVEDRIGISSEIFDFVANTKNLPKTSAVPPEQYLNYFENLKKNYDAIIHISISSDMSCAYNNAVSIANHMENVYVVDSRNLSTGIALICLYAHKLIKQKLSPKEIVKLLVDKTKYVRSSFVIEKLNYLHKGGRCSALTLLGANVLKIKPQISVIDGRMNVAKKYVGNLNKVCEKYCDDLIAEHPNADKEFVFITHSSYMPEIQSTFKSKLEKFGFKNIYDTFAGGTISSHCGPNCIGILFFDGE